MNLKPVLSNQAMLRLVDKLTKSKYSKFNNTTLKFASKCFNIRKPRLLEVECNTQLQITDLQSHHYNDQLFSTSNAHLNKTKSKRSLDNLRLAIQTCTTYPHLTVSFLLRKHTDWLLSYWQWPVVHDPLYHIWINQWSSPI